jgi:DNA primase
LKKGKITPEFLQKIKDAVNLIEVVGEHVVLRKSGANYSGLCPFHQERSPSFSVSEQKQLYHCYGCKKGGDLVSFVMEIHGITFPEAIEELAERGKVPLPKDFNGPSGASPEEDARRAAAREKLNLAFKLNRFVAAFYHHSLSQQPQAREYFRQRGVSDDQIRSFYLGSSSNAWDDLTRHLIAKKAPIDVSQELGLIRPSPKQTAGGPGYFDLFRDRVMFPILDLRGKVVGFGGRSMPSAGGTSDGPKYMNSPESPIFHKSKIAYGLYQAQKFVRERDEVILVEGYFDVIALHSAGFQNVVATCGTALTPEHLNVFKRFASKITVLFDGDRAGITATERAMELGLTHGAVLYGASLPEGLDPDEILFDQETGQATPDGAARMKTILDAAAPLLDTRIRAAAKEAEQGAEARTQALKLIAGWLASYTDPVGREIRVEEVQKLLGVSRSLLDQAMGVTTSRGAAHSRQAPAGPRITQSGQPSQQSRPPVRTIKPATPNAPPLPGTPKKPTGPKTPSAGDRVLLQALALGGHFLVPFSEFVGKLPPNMTIADLFDYFPARVFLTQLLTSEGGEPQLPPGFSLDLGRFSDEELDPQVRSILTEASVRGSVGSVTSSVTDGGGFSAQDVRGAIHRGSRRLWARFSQLIKAAMQDAEANQDAGLHTKLSKEYLDVERKMKEFISFYDEA